MPFDKLTTLQQKSLQLQNFHSRDIIIISKLSKHTKLLSDAIARELAA